MSRLAYLESLSRNDEEYIHRNFSDSNISILRNMESDTLRTSKTAKSSKIKKILDEPYIQSLTPKVYRYPSERLALNRGPKWIKHAVTIGQDLGILTN